MSQQTRRIYMDVSALCRPFDDQAQLRVRLESDAVLLILSQLEAAGFVLVVSSAHRAEIAAIDDSAERKHLQTLLRKRGNKPKFNFQSARKRAEDLIEQGIGVGDAAHLAFAEQAECDFITCDDRLIRQCKRMLPNLCGSPSAYCEKEGLK